MPAVKVNTPAVNHQSIEGEVVAINLATGVYYSLRDLAARIWERVDAGRSREEIAQEIGAAYPGEPDAATIAGRFIDELISEGLVAEGNAAKSLTPEALAAQFATPLLERFTDMQELLLLDPIHEVDQAGWPVKPQNS
jgi:hypothetical protein